jgi:hypothetical protein
VVWQVEDNQIIFCALKTPALKIIRSELYEKVVAVKDGPSGIENENERLERVSDDNSNITLHGN